MIIIIKINIHWILDELLWLECPALYDDTCALLFWACSVLSGESSDKLFILKFNFCFLGLWGAENNFFFIGERRGEGRGVITIIIIFTLDYESFKSLTPPLIIHCNFFCNVYSNLSSGFCCIFFKNVLRFVL